MPTSLIRERWEQPGRDRLATYHAILLKQLTHEGFSGPDNIGAFAAPIGEGDDLYVAVNVSVNGNHDVSGAWHIGDRAVARALESAAELVGRDVQQRVLATGRLHPDDSRETWSVGITSANAPSVAHEVAEAIVHFRDSMRPFGTRAVLADRLEHLMTENPQRLPFGAWHFSGPVFFALSGRREAADAVVATRLNDLESARRTVAVERYQRFVTWFDGFASMALARSADHEAVAVGRDVAN